VSGRATTPEDVYATLSRPPAEVGAPPVDAAPLPPDHAPPGPLPTVAECGQPLVAVDPHLPCLSAYRAAGWAGTASTTWLRSSVVERLVAVHEALPSGFGLAVFDGWRSPETIRALWNHYYGPGSQLEPGFLADPDGDGDPPHLTGGAVDLTLTWRGAPLSLGTPFDEFSTRAHLRALEDAGPEPDRSLRRLLHHAVVAQGFVPFAQEWWHVSFGDQDWAAATGAPAARYGPTAP